MIFSRAKEATPKVLLKELAGDSFAREKNLSVKSRGSGTVY